MSQKRYVIAAALLCTLLYMVPVVANGFTNGQVASVVLGQTIFTNGGSATTSMGMHAPTGMVTDSLGNVWVVDTQNNRVLEYLKGSGFANGEAATTVLGQPGFTSNGSATTTTGLDSPYGIASDSSGNLWVVDSQNNRVVEYTTPFTSGDPATTVLGQPDFTSNGPATTMTGLSEPLGIAIDSSGNVWVADTGNNRILEYLKGSGFANGEAATIVLGQPGFTTVAFSTTPTGMTGPIGIAFDSSGNVWVADTGNNRILEYLKGSGFANGEAATTVLGESDFTTSNFVTSAIGVDIPAGVAIDSSGNVWVTDNGNSRVLEYLKGSGFANGEAATTVLGQADFASNGPATTSTGMSSPDSVAIDSSGNVWVADTGNNRVLEYAGAATTTPTVTTVSCSPSTTIDVGSTTTCTAMVTGQSTSITGETVTWSQTAGTGSVSFFHGTCNLTGLPEICSTVVTAITSGSVTVQVAYQGDLSNSASSNTTALTVDAALGNPTVTPSAITIDSGQTISASVSWTGGTTSYSVHLYSSATSTCSSSSTSVSSQTGLTASPATFIGLSPSSTLFYCATVTDSASTPVTTTSQAVQVTVNPVLTAGAITPSNPSITLGQSETLTAHPSGGTTPYTYQWYTGASCIVEASGATQSTYSPSPASTATYSYKVIDSSSTPATACSPADMVTVLPVGPSITLSPTSAPPGSQVQVSGSGFNPTSAMTIRFAGTPIVTVPAVCTTNNVGSFTCSFTVPSSASQNSYAVSASDGINTAPAVLLVAVPIAVPTPDNCENATPCYTSFVVFNTGQGGVRVSVSSAEAPTQVGYTNSQNLTTGVCAVASTNLTVWGCLSGETGQFTTVVNSTIHYTVTFPDGAVVQGNYVVRGAWTLSVISVAEQHSGSASAAPAILVSTSPQVSLGAPGPSVERIGDNLGHAVLATVLLQTRLESAQI